MDHSLPKTARGGSIDRRAALKVGTAGVLSAATAGRLTDGALPQKPRSVLFVFLTGGLAHHDSFDMKPDAPAEVRGEFAPISTQTPGLHVCEHLPLLAARTEQYALVRSMVTASNGHEPACHMLLTGRLDLPPAFSLENVPNPEEWPSIPAVITYHMRGQKNVSLPPAAILPEPSVNEVGRFRPGQYAGRLGDQHEAWHVDVAAKCPLGNGPVRIVSGLTGRRLSMDRGPSSTRRCWRCPMEVKRDSIDGSVSSMTCSHKSRVLRGGQRDLAGIGNKRSRC